STRRPHPPLHRRAEPPAWSEPARAPPHSDLRARAPACTACANHRVESWHLPPIAMAPERLTQLDTSSPQPRVYGVELDFQRAGDFWSRHLFELRQDKYLALGFVQRVEQREQQTQVLILLGAVLGPKTLGIGQLVRVLRVLELLAALSPTVLSSHPHDDRIQPRAGRAAPLELGQPAMHDQKYILSCIPELPLRHAQTPQIAPSKRELRLVQSLERNRRRPGRHRCRQWIGHLVRRPG